MKRVEIIYNPYKVVTNIKVNGENPKGNSDLNLSGKRLQEWAERFPDILLNEYMDSEVEVVFTGTESDCEYIKSVLNGCDSISVVGFDFIRKDDVEDVEGKINQIFEEIQEGPIEALKSEDVKAAFERVQDQEFAVNVVATMSSGKSTLINALLGKKLMPAANEATTATIVKIIDDDRENDEFDAIAYNKHGEIVERVDNVTNADMQRLNNNESVVYIEIYGDIPFVAATGMKLALTDTPGPNNSRDESHRRTTYNMLENSDNSLVLYVINSTQMGADDEKEFVHHIYETMKEGGKQSRERFIFAVNKLDQMNPEDDADGANCITKSLDSVKDGLQERGIKEPNIFPVTAAAALELRTNARRPNALPNFIRDSEELEEFRFDEFYNFSNLPNAVKNRIEELKDEDNIVEIRTGIVSIEQAIKQYIDTYARTTKVKDLTNSFNSILEGCAIERDLLDNIGNDENKRKQLEADIEGLRSKLRSADDAKKLANEIDSTDYTKSAIAQLDACTTQFTNQIKAMISGRSSEVDYAAAKQQCQKLEQKCKSLSAQIQSKVEGIISESFKTTIASVLDKYKSHMAAIGIGDSSNFALGSFNNNVSGSLNNLASIMRKSTRKEDRGHFETEKQKLTSGQKWTAAGAAVASIIIPLWITAPVAAMALRKKEEEVWKEDIVDVVDMNKLTAEYLEPFNAQIIGMREKAIEFIENKTAELKVYLKEELQRISKFQEEKLDQLEESAKSVNQAEEEINRRQEELQWLKSIEQRVNNLIEF